MRDRHRPRGKGPEATMLAEALLKDALNTLPFKKGAPAEANRINLYLELAGLPTLEAVPCKHEAAQASAAATSSEPDYKAPPHPTKAKAKAKRKPEVKHFDILEVPAGRERQIVPSLKGHRHQQAQGAASSLAIRKRLAHMHVADISVADLQDLVTARLLEGISASTVRHDVHVIRSMIHRVRRNWNWRSLRPIAKGDIVFPALPPGRDRVVTHEEEKRLVQALQTCYHPKAAPAIAFLTETAMRFTEAMLTARWADVDWEGQSST